MTFNIISREEFCLLSHYFQSLFYRVLITVASKRGATIHYIGWEEQERSYLCHFIQPT